MRVISLQGQIFDLDEIASSHIESTAIILKFRNDHQISLSWRDHWERDSVLKALELTEIAGKL